MSGTLSLTTRWELSCNLEPRSVTWFVKLSSMAITPGIARGSPKPTGWASHSPASGEYIYIYMLYFQTPIGESTPKIIGTSPCRAPLRLVTAAPPQGQQVPQALPTWSLPRAARCARWGGSRRRWGRTALLVNYYQLCLEEIHTETEGGPIVQWIGLKGQQW